MTKIAQTWPRAKRGDVCRVVGGSTPSSSVSEYWDGDIVWITPTDLGSMSGQGIRTSARKITRRGFESCGTELVPPGSVVLSSRAPIGYLGIAEAELCTNQGCKSFVPSPAVDPDFLYFVLRGSVSQIRKLGSGATFAEVSKTVLENVEIPLPPMSEQRQISRVLAAQLTAVERARSAAEARLVSARRLESARLAQVFGEIRASNARKWRLADIAESCSGSTPDRSQPEFFGGDIPWVKTAELRDGWIGDTEERITRSALSSCSLRLLPRGTLLIAMYGQGQTRGRTGLLSVQATTNQACFAVLPNPQAFEPKYLQLWFRSAYLNLRTESEGRGGNQSNLNGRILKQQVVTLPPLVEQRKIVAHLSLETSYARLLSQQVAIELSNLNALPAALLRRAFREEL